MALFLQSVKGLEKIKETTFALEKEIQDIIEKNLQIIFNLQFVKSEFSLEDLRIDTLAFDTETKSFVIIEYKRDKNFSVIDQGFAYLGLMLRMKADFILEYNEIYDQKLRKEEVDWSQSRVIFVSPSFSNYQQKAIHFKNIPIELWKIKRYESGIISFNQLKSPETSEDMTHLLKGSQIVEDVSKEVKVYTEQDHLQDANDDIKELYDKLKERVLELDSNIAIKPRQWYIGFVKDTNFLDVHIQKNRIKLWLNLTTGELQDYRSIARIMLKDDGTKIGHWGNGDYEIQISPTDDLDYLMTLIKQSYQKHS